MAKRRQGATRTGAIGGAITPAMPSAPQPSAPISFNQFVAQPGAANANNPTASPAASNPFTAPTPTVAAATNPNQHGTPERQTPPTPTLPGGATPPNPVGQYNPALYADFVRHWYAMQNAKVRGDDPANYGAGPQRTMAF